MERDDSYDLTVDVRTGVLAQSITLQLATTLGTACKAGREGRGGRGRGEGGGGRERGRDGGRDGGRERGE